MNQLKKPVKRSHFAAVLSEVFGRNAKTARPFSYTWNDNPSTLRILVAEDNPINQKVVLKLLERLGHQADVANNGREVLEVLQTQSYDVVLMDVQMPEMDGITATRRICQEWGAQRPRIIAVTANAMRGDRDECLQAGMDDYLSKPIRLEQLMAALSDCQPPKPDAASSAVATTLPSVLDSETLQQFREDLGDDAEVVLSEMIQCYLSEREANQALLAGDTRPTDRRELMRTIHTLKSSSALLGAVQFSAQCRHFEETVVHLPLPALEQELPALLKSYQEVCQALQQLQTLLDNQVSIVALAGAS